MAVEVNHSKIRPSRLSERRIRNILLNDFGCKVETSRECLTNSKDTICIQVVKMVYLEHPLNS